MAASGMCQYFQVLDIWYLIYFQVPDDTNSDGASSKKYADFKRVVWHESFYEILRSIEDHATTGYKFMCGDDILRWIFPFILIASADYEEQ